MSAIAPVAIPARVRRTLVVRWAISPGALAARFPGLAAPELALEVARTDADMFHVKQMLTSGDSSVPLGPVEPARGQWTVDVRTNMEHVDVPGVLAASLERGEPVRVVYARTPLLAALGLAGGRYELIGAEVF